MRPAAFSAQRAGAVAAAMPACTGQVVGAAGIATCGSAGIEAAETFGDLRQHLGIAGLPVTRVAHQRDELFLAQHLVTAGAIAALQAGIGVFIIVSSATTPS